MQPRIDPPHTSASAMSVLYTHPMHVHSALELDGKLLALLELRASQMKGCSLCIGMHSKDARARGESKQRLNALNTWRETTLFSDKERAALAWIEAVTKVQQDDVPNELFEAARMQFSNEELVNLMLAVAVIKCLEPHRHCIQLSSARLSVSCVTSRRGDRK